MHIIRHNYFRYSLSLRYDDVTLLATTPDDLQSQLGCLKRCCEKLKMEVNKAKTKIMVFRKGGYLSQIEKWHFDDCNLEVYYHVKFEAGNSSFSGECKESSILPRLVFQHFFLSKYLIQKSRPFSTTHQRFADSADLIVLK